MNNWAYVGSLGVVFAIGFYAGQKYSELSLVPQAAFSEQSGALSFNADRLNGSRGQGRHNLLTASATTPSRSVADAQSGSGPIPPFDPSQDMAPLEPSPEEIAQQQEMHAELIASMRANYLPKADIEQMEKSFAAQKEALVNKSDEHPPQERSTAELAAEARESLRQSGVPKKVIEDMVESMYPSTNPKRP